MEITLELSDLVVMQSKRTLSHIFHKKLATGRPLVKILIKYKSNSLKEMMKKRRSQLILSLLRKIR